MRIVRRIYWLVMACLVLLAVAAGQVNSTDGIVFAVMGIIFWWFVGAYFARLIGVMMVSSLRCKGCGLEIPAVGRWQIGSYTDHRDRHVLWAKNPIDGGRMGHINCPQCSCTVII